jgi:hypothetical protein
MKTFNHIKTQLSSFAIATSPRISGIDAMMLRTSIIFLKALEVSPNMKAIKILKCGKNFGNSDAEKHRLMKHISIICPNLCDFYLSECDDDVHAYIFDLFPALTKLVIIKKRSRTSTTSSVPSSPHMSTSLSLTEGNIKFPRLYMNVKTVEIDSISPALATKVCACPNLTKLVIATNELTEQMLEAILQSCVYLSDLRIECNISEEMCRSIAAYGRHLKDLHLLSSRVLTPTQGQLLSPVIQSLSWFIWHSASIEDGAIQALLPSPCVQMRTFQIGRGNSPNTQINVNDLRIMTSAFPNLTAMFIPCCLTPGNDALVAIATIKLPLLGLVIHVDGMVSGLSMTSLLTSCSNLQTVEMHTHELSCEAIFSIAQHGTHLRDLILHSKNAFPVLPHDLPSFASQAAPRASSTVKLRSLELCGPGSIDIRSLAILINNFASVNELKLVNVPFRDNVNATLIPFQVASLKLESIDSLNDFTLMRLGSCTLNLRQLRIRNCQKVSAVSIGTIAGMLRASLRSILYYDCDAISDNATAELSKIFADIKIGHRLDGD